MIIKHSNEDINQSVQHKPTHMIPTMAGSRTYVGSAYYDSRQLVTTLDGRQFQTRIVLGPQQDLRDNV